MAMVCLSRSQADRQRPVKRGSGFSNQCAMTAAPRHSPIRLRLPGVGAVQSRNTARGGRMSHALTVVGLFANREDAEHAVRSLIQSSFPPEEVGYLEPTEVRDLKNPARGAVKGVEAGGVSGGGVVALPGVVGG